MGSIFDADFNLSTEINKKDSLVGKSIAEKERIIDQQYQEMREQEEKEEFLERMRKMEAEEIITKTKEELAIKKVEVQREKLEAASATAQAKIEAARLRMIKLAIQAQELEEKKNRPPRGRVSIVTKRE